MAGVPPDLSAFKPSAGNAIAAAPIANGFTALEGWATNAIDPAAMLQKGAILGQTLTWDGTKWAPASPVSLVAPTLIGPTNGGGISTGLAANNAYLSPVAVVTPTTISRLQVYVNSGGGTGNVDVGIYFSDDDATFTRLVSKGTTVTPAGPNAALTVGATVITPVVGRRWYLAFGCSSATPTFAQAPGSYPNVTYTKSGSFPLPASLTGMTLTTVAPTVLGLI